MGDAWSVESDIDSVGQTMCVSPNGLVTREIIRYKHSGYQSKEKDRLRNHSGNVNMMILEWEEINLENSHFWQ